MRSPGGLLSPSPPKKDIDIIFLEDINNGARTEQLIAVFVTVNCIVVICNVTFGLDQIVNFIVNELRK